MGNQSSSESLASTQSVSNQINNVSNENCITACTSDIRDSNIKIIDSNVRGNVSISAVCNILGSSCVLKAALSNSIQNTQKNKQLGETMQSASPLTWFSNQSNSTTESSNENISNRVSNIVNSTCQNTSSENVEGINIEIIGSSVGGNVNLSADGDISKSQCIIDNTTRTTLSNDQTNSQTAKVMQGSPLLFGIIAVVIVVVVVMIGIVILGVGGLGVLGVGAVGMKSLKKKPQNRGPPPQYKQRPSAPPMYKPRPSAPPQVYRAK